MTDESKPTVHRRSPDPLGYDTSQPFRAVARAMADDALGGQHQKEAERELEVVRKRWRMSEWPTGTKP